MPGTPLHALVAAAGVALAACASSVPSAKEAPVPSTATNAPAPSMPVKEWPLRFRSHSFGAFCYDTLSCTIKYANLAHGSDDPSPPSSTYGPRYMEHLSGGHGMIRNFPPPAEVSWRSRDGQPHSAEIDIGEIFKDELIRHNVPRDEMADVPNGVYSNEPAIILEINDRTIRVWMRAMIFLKKRIEVAGVMRADFKDDLVLVRTYAY